VIKVDREWGEIKKDKINLVIDAKKLMKFIKIGSFHN
jgi:hypothetical protein